MNDEVTLREITAQDGPMLVRWRNDPANARWFPKQDPWTDHGHLQWYLTSYLTDPSQNLYLVRRGAEAIGTVGMTIKNGGGELERMMLGRKELARGGFMRQGMRQLMGAYGLDHYWLRVMPDNEATLRFHKRNGFTVFSQNGGEYENILGERGQYLVMTKSFGGVWERIPS